MIGYTFYKNTNADSRYNFVFFCNIKMFVNLIRFIARLAEVIKWGT